MDFNKPSILSMDGDVAVNFQNFREEVEIYMVATEIDKKARKIQVARLKNLLGTDALRLYKSLTTVSEDEETVQSILNTLKEHCITKRNQTLDIYRFLTRTQSQGEPFERFQADLKNLIKPCDFEDQTEKLLKTQIILGIRDQGVKEKLLREDTTLEKTIAFCKSTELAEKSIKMMNEQEKTQGIDEVKAGTQRPVKKGTQIQKCKKCGYSHGQVCPAEGKTCFKCNKLNHFASVCRTPVLAHEVTEKQEREIDFSIEVVEIDHIKTNRDWMKTLTVEGEPINFKLDSGAQVNVLPLNNIPQIIVEKIQKTETTLKAYGGAIIKPVGLLKATIKNGDKKKFTEFIIVDQPGCIPILGSTDCEELGCILKIDMLNQSAKEKFIKQNKDVFTGLGEFPDTCHIEVKADAVPKVCPPRRVPESIKGKLSETLKLLENNDIICKINSPKEWVHNVVIVEKPDKSLRICIDPIELNKHIKREFYCIPTLEEITSKLQNKKYFCVFDLKDGFFQIKLDDESSNLCTFTTPYGCYRFKRAPFGLSSIPEIFQKLTHKYFGDLEGVTVYFDDILCAAETVEELKVVVAKVLDRARTNNIKFNPNKLQYFVNEVKYFGLNFSEGQIKPDQSRIRAINDLEPPKCKKEMQKLLGMVNFLRPFLPNLSEILNPFRNLLKNDTEWIWTEGHQESFKKLKELIGQQANLTPFNPNKQLEIQCDASKDAIGCCLMQCGKPIFYASRSMTDTESNYAQIEKEMLSVYFACKKFHNMIYGKKIIIFNDHQPLVSLMNKDFNKIKNNRLKRLRLHLLVYDFELKFLPGSKLYVADLLSRNLIRRPEHNMDSMKDVIHTVSEGVFKLSDSKLAEFQKETVIDKDLSQVMEWYKVGWPRSCKQGGEAAHYLKLKNDITVENQLVYFQDRLVVPPKLRKCALKAVHETHLGLEKTKFLAKTNLYWPAMLSDIESFVSSCGVCHKWARANKKQPLLSHDRPDIPYYKVAADIADYGGKSYLVVVDYYSRWLELEKLSQKNSKAVIDVLKKIFSRNGVPETLIADNMPFNSIEMLNFAKAWNVNIITSSPHYPKSNGLAEKGVGISKMILKKAEETNQDVELHLLNYRNATVAGLGCSPSQLLNSRQLRSKIPTKVHNLKPVLKSQMITERMKETLKKQKDWYDTTAYKSETTYTEGEQVLLRSVTANTWEEAKIIKKLQSPRF